MNTDTIICNLYETRTKLGYTQRQVAEGTSISVRTLINIEKGENIAFLVICDEDCKLPKSTSRRIV